MAAGPMHREEAIKEKKDPDGAKWSKVYFGSGSHFRNWLSQVLEIYGDGNVEVEEVKETGLACYDVEGEQAYRIWVRQRDGDQPD